MYSFLTATILSEQTIQFGVHPVHFFDAICG